MAYDNKAKQIPVSQVKQLPTDIPAETEVKTTYNPDEKYEPKNKRWAKWTKYKGYDYNREYTKTYYRKLRETTLSKLGGKCACCGETEPKFLVVDHIHCGKENPAKRSSNIYLELKKRNWPINEFQLLCYNCNMAKDHYGHCPHQKVRTLLNPMDSYCPNLDKAEDKQEDEVQNLPFSPK